MKLSILTPAFNEADNLPGLYDRLVQTMVAVDGVVGGEWEWLIVDDHSSDRTFEVIQQIARRDPRVRGVRLARNSGSHAAITCGLHLATGNAAVMMAADLQDPPETLKAMLERWQRGAQVVWAVRRQRPGQATHAGFAAFYYWMMRHPVGLREIPERGADFFLVDAAVIEAFRRFPERNVSVFALITWLGFRQEFIEYEKLPRVAGVSGWTTAKKVKLVIDSVTSFSEFPIRMCTYGGLGLMSVGLIFLIASLVLLPSLGAGLLFLLAAVVGLAGLQLLALGIVGEYVWRALDEARRRPQYIIEAATDGTAVAGGVHVSP